MVENKHLIAVGVLGGLIGLGTTLYYVLRKPEAEDENGVSFPPVTTPGAAPGAVGGLGGTTGGTTTGGADVTTGPDIFGTSGTPKQFEW